MPHLKVKKFNTSLLDALVLNDDRFLFRAKDKYRDDELLGILFEDTEFMLAITVKDDAMLIKPDLISRPSDVSKIKKILQIIQEKMDFEIIHSNIDISTTKPTLSNEAYKRISDFLEPDFSHQRVAIEVGFGSGRHLLHQAQNNPETLFVGIEIHTPSIEKVLKQIKLQDISNVWVINYDARLLLEMMPSNICSDIYVHFPVPWDKKAHRRVISLQFMTEALRVLSLRGELELRTDSVKYYEYSKEIFDQLGKEKTKITKNKEAVISSKYEDRWRAQGKDIYTLEIESNEISRDVQRGYSFDFDRLSEVDELFLEAMPKKAFVFDDYFVHFEGQYRIFQSNEMLLKCAFGSFNAPEHKYLKVGSKRCYYPHNPVPSNSNYQAHTKIGEMIYG